MRSEIPDFKAASVRAQAALGEEGADRLLDAGRRWNLGPVLRDGGAVVFPHVGIETCGHMTAAAVHACLDSGAQQVLVLGVLHALTRELDEARVRVAAGGDASGEPSRGIQGPGLDGRDDWLAEFSLSNFLFLWEREVARRGIVSPGGAPPELVVRYPYLAGGRPEDLPGIRGLGEIARDAAIVATADPFHHGIGYGDPVETALAPDAGGLDLARRRIDEGLQILRSGDYWGYNGHCVDAKSDARDVGQLLRLLIGEFDWRILDLVSDDMSAAYDAPAPTWVAGALIELEPVAVDGTRE